jgi:putative oxidoreductase
MLSGLTGSTPMIDRNRLIIPALGGVYGRFAPLSYAFMRFSTGAVLLPHGIQKVAFTPVQRMSENIAQHGLPMSTFLAYCTFFAESVAAACLMMGLFTRLAALVIWLEMAVIITLFQWNFGYFWTNRGFEYALLWWLLCTAIVFRGGGRFSIDYLLGREF